MPASLGAPPLCPLHPPCTQPEALSQRSRHSWGPGGSPSLVLWPSSCLSAPWFSSGRAAGLRGLELVGAGRGVPQPGPGWLCDPCLFRARSLQLGLDALGGRRDWSRRAGCRRVNGDRGFSGILFFFPRGGSQSYIRVPFPGFLRQRTGDPSIFLGRPVCSWVTGSLRAGLCLSPPWQNAAQQETTDEGRKRGERFRQGLGRVG